MTEDQPHESNQTKINAFVREHSTWLIGLVPVLIVGLDLLFLARGNPQVLGYVLHGMSISTVVFGIFLPGAPLFLGLLLGYWLSGVRLKPDNRRSWSTYQKTWSDICAFMVALIIVVSSPISNLILVLVFVSIMVGMEIISNRSSRIKAILDREDNTSSVAVYTFLSVTCALLVLMVNVSRWIPFENVSVEHGPIYTGQVLSSDGEWTVLLSAGRRIVILHTKQVASRQPCLTGSQLLHRLNASVIDFNMRPNPPCAERIPAIFNSPPQDPVDLSPTSTPPSTTHVMPPP